MKASSRVNGFSISVSVPWGVVASMSWMAGHGVIWLVGVGYG